MCTRRTHLALQISHRRAHHVDRACALCARRGRFPGANPGPKTDRRPHTKRRLADRCDGYCWYAERMGGRGDQAQAGTHRAECKNCSRCHVYDERNSRPPLSPKCLFSHSLQQIVSHIVNSAALSGDSPGPAARPGGPSRGPGESL